MLSIGKLATGQADYYLEQAAGRIDRATSVASGVEDYYLEGPEPDGVWIGAGAARLGAAGRVPRDAFRHVLEGRHPHTGEPLGRHAAARVPGSTSRSRRPKSVSVLFGIGDECAATHDPELRTRRRSGTRSATSSARPPSRGAGRRVASAFAGMGSSPRRSGIAASRAGDPQLHTHVVVANLVQADDGRWSALDARRLYAHAKTAGYLYEARLRAELTRELGVEWTPVRNGIADIAGVPRDVLQAFSRRRAQIEAELARRGQSGPRAAQAATLETRRRKDHAVDPGDARRAVARARRRARTSRASTRASLLGRAAPTLDADLLRDVHRELAGRDGLTRTRSSFTRRDVLQAWCERLPAGAPVDVALLERLADHFLASEDAVVPRGRASRPASRDEVLQRHDGRMVRALPDERRYSTDALLRAEERLVRRALQGRDARPRARGAAGGRARDRRAADALRRAGGDGAAARRRRRRAWRSWSVPRAPARRSRSLPRERRGKRAARR